jgi:hypothetical protein
MIKDGVVFASGHEGEARQIGEDRSRAILSVEAQQGERFRQLVRREVACDRGEALTQFLPVATVAPVAKTAEPLETMGLTNDGTSAHHLSPLAPSVARSTDLIQPAKGWGQVFCLGQGALASRLSRPVDVKDHPDISRSIQQSPRLLLGCVVGVDRE